MARVSGDVILELRKGNTTVKRLYISWAIANCQFGMDLYTFNNGKHDQHRDLHWVIYLIFSTEDHVTLWGQGDVSNSLFARNTRIFGKNFNLGSNYFNIKYATVLQFRQ